VAAERVVHKPECSSEDLCQQATELLERGEIEAAVDRLQRALDLDGECARACYLLGGIWADAGRWAEARHWVELAVEQDVFLAEGHFLLGLVHYQEGDLGQALAAIKRVVYLDRDAVLGHLWMANLYRELGDESRAQKSLENTDRLLAEWSPEALIPWSDGLTAGRLRQIVRQLQGNL
jgi:chemotaxis protein methyltransferase CheR